jgi:nucleotide-binding universal stress UspA family protein
MRDERLARSTANAEAAIAEGLAVIEAAGIPVHTETHHGDPMAFLCQIWRYHDLCVLGVRGWFDHGVMAEPEAAMTNLASLGLRPILAVTDRSQPVERVLIAYNGTLTSAKAMKRFTQLRLWPDAEIHLAVFDKPEGEPEDLLRDAKGYLEAYGLSVKASHYKSGARDGILTTANAVEADLIVMGTASYQSLRRKIFGDVTGYVVKNAECPVFLAH